MVQNVDPSELDAKPRAAQGIHSARAAKLTSFAPSGATRLWRLRSVNIQASSCHQIVAILRGDARFAGVRASAG